MESRDPALIGGNAEGICHTIEKREQRRHIDRFRNLRLAPSEIPQRLNILSRCTVGSLGDFLHIFEQRSVCRIQGGALQVSRAYGYYSSFFCPLFTQGVGMSLESIWTAIEIRHPGRDSLFRSALQMAI